jgi:hypothetical protein
MTALRTLYCSGPFEVTTAYLRTPLKTYRLDEISHVAIRRPALLPVITVSAGLIAYSAVFASELYAGEIAALLVACFGLSLLSARLGILVLFSHVLAVGKATDVVTWDIGALREVRDAIDKVMLLREQPAARPAPPVDETGP